jgi:hypothetical protein
MPRNRTETMLKVVLVDAGPIGPHDREAMITVAAHRAKMSKDQEFFFEKF